MCEACDETREKMWNEIRDLLHFNRDKAVNGPLARGMKEKIEAMKLDPDLADDWEEMTDQTVAARIDSIRAQMIAERAAVIATCCPGAQFHNMMPSVALGAWAGKMMEGEIIALGNPILGLIFGFPEASDDA